MHRPPVFRLLAERARYPVLVHYTNGKDRVGVLTALLLERVGVLRQTISAGFLVSNVHLEGKSWPPSSRTRRGGSCGLWACRESRSRS